MEWDYYYEWHVVLVMSGWLKGYAAALWLPALAAAASCRFLKSGILGRLPAFAMYVVAAGGWAGILLSLRGTNSLSPAWFEAASLASVPLALAGILVILWTPIPVTADARRGCEVVTKQRAL